MKFKYAILFCTTILLLSACGGNDVVEIGGGSVTASPQASGEGTAVAMSAAGAVTESYTFTVNGKAIAPDMDMAEVLSAIGKEQSYFEAESCAFQGMDKMYTYADFEIDTYPQGDKDLVSVILFKNDLVKTDEGIAIGMGLEDIQKAYGNAQEENGAVILNKGNMQLQFLLKDGVITSIEYDSLAAKG